MKCLDVKTSTAVAPRATMDRRALRVTDQPSKHHLISAMSVSVYLSATHCLLLQ